MRISSYLMTWGVIGIIAGNPYGAALCGIAILVSFRAFMRL